MDKAHAKQGDNTQIPLLPMSPKMDYSDPKSAPGAGNTGVANESMPPTAPDRRQSEKASLPEKKTLNEEALNLLDQYSTKAKTDCVSGARSTFLNCEEFSCLMDCV